MRGLKRLSLGSTAVTDATLAHVARFRELTELNLAATEVTDAGIARLRGMRRLKVLYLTLTPITDDVVATLCDMPSLETLDLTGTCISQNAVRELENRIKQRRSEQAPANGDSSERCVSWLPLSSERERKIAAAAARHGVGVERSMRCDWTEHRLAVSIYHSLDRQGGRQALPLLPQLTSLSELSLMAMSLDDEDVEHLRCIPNLKHLDLHNTPITTAQWRRLASDGPCDAAKPHVIPPDAAANSGLRKHLESLSYANAPISSADVEQIARMSKLTSLSFSETPLTDGALVHLESLPNLTSLDLGDTPITDAGLSHVETLTDLRYLQLYGAKVTAQGVERLRAALPNSNVLWYAQPSDTEMVP